MRRKNYRTVAVVSVLAFLTGIAVGPIPSRAIDLGDILKAGGIAFLVKQFGKEINGFINKVMGQRGIEREGMTKVVPVVRVGSGTAVGAVQVIGAESQVKQVQAVAELELTVGNRARARALLPVTTKKVATDSIKSVGGVGVSANIKFRL